MCHFSYTISCNLCSYYLHVLVQPHAILQHSLLSRFDAALNSMFFLHLQGRCAASFVFIISFHPKSKRCTCRLRPSPYSRVCFSRDPILYTLGCLGCGTLVLFLSHAYCAGCQPSRYKYACKCHFFILLTFLVIFFLPKILNFPKFCLILDSYRFFILPSFQPYSCLTQFRSHMRVISVKGLSIVVVKNLLILIPAKPTC